MSNLRRLGPASFADLLASSIKDDPIIAATSAALDPILQKAVTSIPNLLIWPRLAQDSSILSPPMQRLVDFADGLKPFSDEELELLAWQEHVDFWQTEWPRKVREGLIRNSTAWHRLKGTPAGMKMAFALFGMSVKIDEGGHGIHWARYQLGFDEITDLSFVNQAWKVALEMQPARCQLFRLYTKEYNITPLIFSEGAYSEHFFSFFSGVPASVIGDNWQANDDLQLSFGVRHSFETDLPNYDENITFAGISRQGFEIPYISSPMWSYFAYSDAFPMRHGFAFGELFSLDFCDTITANGHWDRTLPPWSMHITPISRSQLVFSDPYPSEDSGLSGVNACYGVPTAVRIHNPMVWGKSFYSEDTERELVTLHERFIARIGLAIPSRAQEAIHAGMQSVLGFATSPLHDDAWTDEAWSDEPWYKYYGYLKIESVP